MPQTARPGASLEVLEHRWALHLDECPDADDVIVVRCPCGQGAVQLCRTCREPIFIVLLTDDLPCSHLAAFYDGFWS
jgi:hypothetical protein